MKKVNMDMEWQNIDHEEYRVYIFSWDKKVRIDKPVLINVSKSGGHRILDAEDVSHYIPSGWVHLYWETNDECAFRF